jgi:hypothetical protein
MNNNEEGNLNILEKLQLEDTGDTTSDKKSKFSLLS